MADTPDRGTLKAKSMTGRSLSRSKGRSSVTMSDLALRKQQLEDKGRALRTARLERGGAPSERI